MGKKCHHGNVHSSTAYNIQKMEATQQANNWLNKCNLPIQNNIIWQWRE